MIRVFGEYSAEEYRVYVDDCGNVDEVYQAGNSPCDSQGYVTSADGVGLRAMRSFCASTAKEIAQELGGKYAGIVRDHG